MVGLSAREAGGETKFDSLLPILGLSHSVSSESPLTTPPGSADEDEPPASAPGPHRTTASGIWSLFTKKKKG